MPSNRGPPSRDPYTSRNPTTLVVVKYYYGVRGAAGPKANPGAGGAKRRDGSDAASPDDDEGATGGSPPRNPSHQAEGMDTMPVETLQAEPPEPSAESVFVNVLLEPYLW